MEGLSQSSGIQVLTIASANINSFNNSVPDVTKLFNEQKLDILFLQETHRVDLSKIKPYLNLCDLALFPNAPSMEQANHHFKSGTAILLRNTTNTRRRKQRSQLLELLEERIQEEAYDFLLLIGDFNMVLCQIDATAPWLKVTTSIQYKTFYGEKTSKTVFVASTPSPNHLHTYDTTQRLD